MTLTQLARRTAIPAGTLRVWQSRHGFPARAPEYDETDVEAVAEVVRLRAQGLSLAAAIAHATASASAAPPSVFARLRERRPDLAPAVLAKPALLDLTRAVEDEYCARGGGGLVLGSFQRVRFYRASETRWRELSRTAELAVALADFRALREPRRGAMEVPVPRDHPLAREWTLVVDAPRVHACIASWERPGEDRLFEVVWSPDPEVARDAAIAAAGVVEAIAPRLAAKLPPLQPPPASGADVRAASALAQRAVAYLAGTSRLTTT